MATPNLIYASTKYEDIRSETLRGSVDALVKSLKGREFEEIVQAVRDQRSVDIRPSMVGAILGEVPMWQNLSGISQQRIQKQIENFWLKDKRYPSFDQLADAIKQQLKIQISPQLIDKIVGRRVNEKLKNLGGRSMVDVVGEYAMQGLGKDQIVAELEERGLSDVVPPRRIVELWDYYKRLHPEETLRLQLGDDHTYAVQRDPSQYADLIKEMSEQKVPASQIAAQLGISEVEVWSHLLGAKSDKVHIQMRSQHDLDQAALNAAGRLPTQWEGDGPSPADISRFEGVQGSGQRRIDRFRKLQKGEPTTSPAVRRGPGDYDWAMGQMPELQGYRGVELMNELNARNPEGFVPWTRSHTNKLQRDYVSQQPVMAFARPSDRFVRLGQLNPGPAAGAAAGVAPAGAAGTAVNTQQVQQQQQVDRNKQITDLKLSVDRLRKAISTAEASLAGQRMELQKQTANLVALQQQR